MKAIRSLEQHVDCLLAYDFSDLDEDKLMKQLKKVEIGENCFSPDSCWPPRKGCFRLKDCPLLRELTIGDSSFSYYSVCEMDNLPSLRMIEIGRQGDCPLFQDAPLELRSR